MCFEKISTKIKGEPKFRKTKKFQERLWEILLTQKNYSLLFLSCISPMRFDPIFVLNLKKKKEKKKGDRHISSKSWSGPIT